MGSVGSCGCLEITRVKPLLSRCGSGCLSNCLLLIDLLLHRGRDLLRGLGTLGLALLLVGVLVAQALNGLDRILVGLVSAWIIGEYEIMSTNLQRGEKIAKSQARTLFALGGH